MRLKGIRRSTNVSDRRGRGGGRVAMGGIGGVGAIVVLLVGWYFGVDLTPLVTGQGGTVTQSSAPRELTPAEQEAGDFASRVLATTEDVWGQVYPEQVGEPYQAPQLVLFSGMVQSGCGGASSATGPFYCPGDSTVYLDTDFFATMQQELGAGGDFAAAYVIAHEVGHHVENLLGVLNQVQRSAGAEGTQVRIELMADCFAGIWGQGVEDLLEPGDVEEAINAAQRIGDDYLQRRAGQAVNPDGFTHGTSEQRASWFMRGYQSGDMQQCDTFSAESL